MNRRTMQSRIRKARRTIDRVSESLANAEIFMAERKGGPAALRILRDAHAEVRSAQTAIESALSESRIHRIPLAVLTEMQDSGLDPESEVAEWVYTVLRRGQHGSTIQSTAAVLGMTIRTLNRRFDKAGLDRPQKVARTSTVLTAVAMLQMGRHADQVAVDVGYVNSLSLSRALKEVADLRIKTARAVDDFDALVSRTSRQLLVA